MNEKSPFVYEMIKEYMLSSDFIDGMNFDQFISGLTSNITDDQRPERAELLYKVIKQDNDEGLSAEDIVRLVLDCGETMSLTEAQTLIKTIAANGQRISKEEFVKYISQSAISEQSQ